MNQQKQQFFEEGKKLIDEGLMNQGVDEGVQKMINKPQIDPTGVNATDLEYLEAVMKLINDRKIDLHTPETLMNKDVYDNLDELSQSTADVNAVNLLDKLRQVKKLYDTGDRESFQIQNLMEHIRQTKSRIEKECGDVYII
jgi:hypothetical protein